MSQENLYQESENTTGILEGIRAKYLPYWPVFAGLVLLSCIGAFLYLRYATPIYETTSKILIKDEKKGLDESKIMESLDLFSSKKIVENEIEIIKSVELITQVVENLRLYAPITMEGTVKNISGYVSSPVKVEFMYPDSLVEVDRVYFSYDFSNALVTLDDKKYPLGSWFRSPYGVMRFVPNERYQQPLKPGPLFFSLVRVYEVTHDLLESLEVEAASKQSTIIYLTLRDPVSKRSEDILNELIAVYNKAAVEDKNILAANTLNFVNTRLYYVSAELDSVENAIQQFKNSHNIVDISEQGKMFLATVGQADEEVSRNTIQLAVLDEVQHFVDSNNVPGIVPSTLGVTDPLLGQLLEKFYDAELQYQSLRKTTAENNPILISLKNEIESLRPKILENIRIQKRSLKTQRTAEGTERDRFSSILSTLPLKEKELLQISRQQSIKNNIYTFLLQKREETALSLAATVSDSRLVDKAHSSINPISPKKVQVFFIAVALGLFIGIAIVGVKDILNPNILFRNEIENLTTLPIIAEIGFDKSMPIVISEGKRNITAEQFRQLRTSLSYIGVNGENKRIMITSSMSGEGKSFITSNLGVALALADKKVLLIELDLRKPRLSSIFGMKAEFGATNYFIGDKSAEDIVRQTDVHKNLFIIPSGPIPPNPSELIMNGRLPELLNSLDAHYDYILIDTAPMGPVTDAYIISNFVNATLFVIRHGITSKTVFRKLNLTTRLGALTNMAIVFNGVKARGIGKYGYEYGYGYEQGRGYKVD